MAKAGVFLIGVFVASLLVILGCEQKPSDSSNAIVSGNVYRSVVYKDSTWRDSVWVYTDWDFYDPAESVQVWIEGDCESEIPYAGPDVMGYTDSLGRFEIPIYLGHTLIKDSDGSITGYEYVYYADVRVWCVYKGGLFYDFGGGITLEAGEVFELFPICIEWPSPTESQ
jgi:hypothetical protein